MAAANARIVRYLLFAVFFIIAFYFISSSSYNTTPLRPENFGVGKGKTTPPSTDTSASHSVADLKTNSKASGASDDSASGSSSGSSGSGGSGGSHIGTGSSGSKYGSGSGSSAYKGSGQSPVGSPMQQQDLAEAPMALTPADAGWDDLVGIAPGPRMNATFVTLARNSDVWEIAKSIRQVEDRFNRRYNYDWVFLNDKPFDATFKKITTSLVSGKTHYGEIPKEHWSFPDFIDQDKAEKVREDMKERKIIYGDSISYRHMCRFESGFFFQQELMKNYEWYWRVEPSIELYCDLHYDPFRFMSENKKKYSFVISLYEYIETIPTLWDSVKKFVKNYPEHIAEGNSMGFLSDDKGETYNKCHFWSNFEIGNLNWLRSKAYTDYFNSLDRDGGFFYERWGDAPVHSIAAGLLLKKEEIHFFNDIAYWHVPFTHCPTGEKTRLDRRCTCDPKNNFDWKGYSCTARYFEFNGMEKPEGWENQS